MKLFYVFLVFLICKTSNVYSQNAVVGSGFSSGWGGVSCNTNTSGFTFLASSFGTSFGSVLTPNGSGNQYFRFGIGWDMTIAQRTITEGSNFLINPLTKYTLNSTCTTSGAMFINVPSISHRYVFKTENGGTNPSGNFIIFQLESSPASIVSVVQSPHNTGVSPSSSVQISSIIDKVLPGGQGVYLRYTTDNWTTSTIVPMSGIDKLKKATIPSQPLGTLVKYYAFTSGENLSISHGDADFYTINGNTNGGLNYQYTVVASPQVTISPTLPTDDIPVTFTINASGTPLAGASKVYLHAGASSEPASLTSFHHVTGNWGQDDGVGLMTAVAGSPDLWQLTIPNARSYFGVPNAKDIYGINFLFRNATGTLKVDNGGINYHVATSLGNHFVVTSPNLAMQTIQAGQSFSILAESSVATSSWILKDTTTTPATTIYTTAGSTNFNYTFNYPDANIRNYKLIATYSSGATKHKLFTLIGYQPAIELPRPTGMKLGVNYNPSDPTTATLILHAPTYTVFKKGTGTTSGTNNTLAKNIIYVIGDFNSWTPSETYKMIRDRDGWNGISDSDNDMDRGDYWWITLTGLNPGQEYVFQYLIDGVLQVADPYTHKVSDSEDNQILASVFPDLVSYRPQAVDRASIIQTNRAPFSWKAAPFSAPEKKDLLIYEMHFRDFTDEGTYRAAIDKLDYVKGLGINAIHVMPVSEFEGNSSWGYNPNFYFAADKAYGPAEDLKKFIDACHERKILVFNDLVLNHAFYSNVMARMYWNTQLTRPADDNPWFNPVHKMVRNIAGHWGADINHESVHTQNMVDSILGYWLSEYNFDGFRFDFTKGFGQTDPNNFPAGDDWASAYNQDRIDLVKRMVDRMTTYYPGSIPIFEHLASSSEDKVLADHGILMWSGVGHHNALKNYVLGYNTDNTNIYDSGIYNTPSRNFAQPHWMSYGESHDEERLGYELLQYFNGTRNTTTMIDRLKIAYGFNLLMPGTRMLWQFGELGYDVSINFNGRTGEKPVRWDYYEDTKRKELHSLISRILKARSKYNLFSTTPDYGNIGTGAGNIAVPRVMRLSSNTNKHVIVVANLDPNVAHDVVPTFDVTGDWYRYNGVLDESVYNVTSGNLNGTYLLGPSEMMIFTNFKIDECSDVRTTADNGENSLRDAINCAPNNGIVAVEYPVFNDTITLSSPILIDKNITIKGFAGQNILINGNSLTQPIFSIAAGRTVSIEGIKFKCSSGNIDGRCLVNAGNLNLSKITLVDSSSNSPGSTIINQGSGTLIISNDVEVKK